MGRTEGRKISEDRERWRRCVWKVEGQSMSGLDGTPEVAARFSVLLLWTPENDGMSLIYTNSWGHLYSDFFPVLGSWGEFGREKMLGQ